MRLYSCLPRASSVTPFTRCISHTPTMLLPHEIRNSSNISSGPIAAHKSPSTEDALKNGSAATVGAMKLKSEVNPHTAATVDTAPLSLHNTTNVTTTSVSSSSSSSCEAQEAALAPDVDAAVVGMGQAALTDLRHRPRFSFLADPHHGIPHDALTLHVVPNNTPKPLLPMWASSLTSPRLGKQRLRVENWISADSMGTLPAEHVMEFTAWLRDQLNHSACSVLFKQLEENVEFSVRSQYTRGVIARKGFYAGEAIFAIPLRELSPPKQQTQQGEKEIRTDSHLSLWGLVLNSETLERHSVAAQRRGAPSYATVEAIVKKRTSSFDPIPHPLFIDQVYTAALLACEKAEGTRSPLYPYLRLLTPFDDDLIRELHTGVLDPPTHLEYNDHCNRFTHYLRQIHTVWLDAYEISCHIKEKCQASTREKETDVAERSEEQSRSNLSPENSGTSEQLSPPCMEDFVWAFRVVLSRQRLLPLRQKTDHVDAICTEDKRMQNVDDVFTRLITKLRWTLMDRVFGAIDHKRMHVNDFDPQTLPTVVPVIDMLQHPPGGVANTSVTLECLSADAAAADTVIHQAELPEGEWRAPPGGTPCAVVRALCEVEAGDELTVLFPRCYSLSYTLYRFGFLPLRRRADDVAAAAMEQHTAREPLQRQFTAHRAPPLLRSAECTRAQEH